MSVRLSTIRAIAAALLGTLLVGCDAGEETVAPDRDTSNTTEEPTEPNDSGIAVPHVPRGPALHAEGTFPPDAGRTCLRRAAGIAGWRSFLRPWSAGPALPIDVPVGTPDGRLRNLPIVGIDTDGMSLEHRRVSLRDTAAPDTGETGWTPERRKLAVERLRAETAEPLVRGGDASSTSDRRVQIAASSAVAPADVAALSEALADASVTIFLAVQHADDPPPVGRPRPTVVWLEDLIATYERRDPSKLRRRLLNEAIDRATGSCDRLRPALRDLFDRPLASARDVGLVEAVANCRCNEIDWKPVEGMAIWSLQPLGNRVGTVRTTVDELRDADASTIGDWLDARSP